MVKVGIAGWIDKELIGSGKFYPPEATSSEDRLRFSARQFPRVEVASSYHGMPARKNSELWVERTPPDFTFDVKSFSLFTQHPTNPKALPPEVREWIPGELAETETLNLE